MSDVQNRRGREGREEEKGKRALIFAITSLRSRLRSDDGMAVTSIAADEKSKKTNFFITVSFWKFGETTNTLDMNTGECAMLFNHPMNV